MPSNAHPAPSRAPTTALPPEVTGLVDALITEARKQGRTAVRFPNSGALITAEAREADARASLETEILRWLVEARQYEIALLAIYDEAQRQVMRGDRMTYVTASEPLGIRGGEYTTRVGDLCTMRDAIQRLLPYELRQRAIEAERAARSVVAAPVGEAEQP